MNDMNKLWGTLDRSNEDKRVAQASAAILKDVYLWMTSALVISGLTAMLVAGNPTLINAIFSSKFGFIAIILAQLGLVMLISSRINKLSVLTATVLFILYAALTGVTLSSIFLVFTQESITSVFFITAGTFAVVSAFGYITKKDLSSLGNILFMGLIGIIIASVVNWFLHSEMLYWIVSYVGVLIFVGLTAYDTQKIKQMAIEYSNGNFEITKKVALIGALSLYLDFINLFLHLLRIFGKRD
jgi:FtsH-binding integral membrane protein